MTARRYCVAALGGGCVDRARADRRAARRFSLEYRGAVLRRHRRARSSAQKFAECAQCGRDTRFGAPLVPHRTFEECARRYPALVTAVAWVLCGSESEAGCCIRDARDRWRFGAECVSHSGLAPMDRVLHARRAWRDVRRFLRATYRARLEGRARSLEVVS